MYTSGTTNKPCGIVHRHQDIVLTNQLYGKGVLGIGPADSIYSTSRLYYAYGFNALFYALLNGASYRLSSQVQSPAATWAVLEQYHPSVFFSVPTQYARLLAYGDAKDYTMINWNGRIGISAGEYLPDRLRQSWIELSGVSMLDGIGTTEVLSTFISNRINDTCAPSTGKIVPGFSVALLDDADHPVADGETGVLWVKGDTMPQQYFNAAEESTRRFKNGWFKTNDLFSRNAEGEYFYHGRSNDLIKSGGIWINPHKIEQVICGHPHVAECVIIGIPDENGLIRPCALVVLKDDYRVTGILANDLITMAKQRCSRWEYPHQVNFVKTLPRNMSNKIVRRQCLAQAV